jgi:hypothetical protein
MAVTRGKLKFNHSGFAEVGPCPAVEPDETQKVELSPSIALVGR